MTNPGTQTGNVGDPVSLQISATDPDAGSTLTYSATGLPDGLTIDEDSGLISGTLSTAGAFSVTVTVSDGDLDAEASFAWNVSQPNRAPSLGAIGNQSVAEGASLPLTLSATDLDTDALTFSLERGCPGLVA